MNDANRLRSVWDVDFKRFTKFVHMVKEGCRDLAPIDMEHEISNS